LHIKKIYGFYIHKIYVSNIGAYLRQTSIIVLQ
jgi:hypothetical protein